jgi:3-oxoacyl-[acyl-carrier protein] reductase
LVNNAGQTRDGLILTMKTADWREVLGTHLDGAFFCTRAVLRDMLAKRRGRIVNVASISGLRGTAGQSNYSAAKAGLIGFTRAVAREMGKKNITVNAVALGVIETDMTAVLPEAVRADYKEQTSLKRFGTVAEVADLIEFVAGPRAAYMTGQVLPLDGGMV